MSLQLLVLKRPILELQKGKKSMEETDNQSRVLTMCWLLFFKTCRSLACVRNHLAFGPGWNISCVCVLRVWINAAALQARAQTLLDSFLLQKSGKRVGLHTFLTPSGLLVMVFALRENKSAHQSYKPTIQISAWPKTLLAMPASQEHGRRLLNVYL